MNKTLKPKQAVVSKKKDLKDNKPGRGNYAILLFVILIVSLIAYLPVFQNGFVNWDDDQYIQENWMLKSIDLKEIFSTYFMGNYHPLTMLALSIEYKVFGMSAAGYHAINLVLHLINVLLIYRVVFMLSGKREISLIATLLFGIHPIHVESVAWVSEIKDLLYALFFLLAFIYYLKYQNTNKKSNYIFSLLLFIIAILSKAMAASLPLLLLITDYFKGRKINIKNIIEKAPYFILALVFGIIAIEAQKSSGSIADDTFFSFTQRIVFACYGYVNYFIKIIFPIGLSAFYPYPVKSDTAIPALYYLYPLILLAFISYLIYSKRFTRKILFGIGFFTVTILLVIQLIPVGAAVMADRYAYIPSIGLFYLAAEGLYFLWNKKSKATTILLIGVLTIFFTVNTYARCKVWKNSMTLWSDVINKNQNVAFAYNSRGVIFDNENKFNEALSDYSKAIELNHRYDKAYNNRGNLLMKNNKFDEALPDYNKSIELKPNYFGSYKNRGNLYVSINKTELAYKDYSKAIALKPEDAEIYFYRGNLLRNLKRDEEALKDYAKALQFDPSNYKVYNGRALLYMNNKTFDESYKDFSKAISLEPAYVDAYLNRGNLLQNQNKYDEALKDYTSAISIQPDNPKIYYNRGNLFMNQNKFKEAINDFALAIKLNNNYALAFLGRGIAECNSGNKNRGCADLQQAINLGFQPANDAFNSLCR